MSANVTVRPLLLPRQQAKLARGRQRQGARHVPNTQYRDGVIGIDIGKNSFHVVGHDARGAIVLRQKWSRGQVEAGLANVRLACRCFAVGEALSSGIPMLSQARPTRMASPSAAASRYNPCQRLKSSNVNSWAKRASAFSSPMSRAPSCTKGEGTRPIPSSESSRMSGGQVE
jgi:hypothetical protein